MENENEMSPVMLRYLKNKDKYNARAKKYFNEVYYPKNKSKLLQNQKEQRLIKNFFYVKEEKTKQTKEKIKKVLYNSLNHSLIVSFD